MLQCERLQYFWQSNLVLKWRERALWLLRNIENRIKFEYAFMCAISQPLEANEQYYWYPVWRWNQHIANHGNAFYILPLVAFTLVLFFLLHFSLLREMWTLTAWRTVIGRKPIRSELSLQNVQWSRSSNHPSWRCGRQCKQRNSFSSRRTILETYIYIIYILYILYKLSKI